MREILFRGKRRDNKEWIYGSYIENHNGVQLYNKELDSILKLGSRYIDKSTLGQYTGVNDFHKFKIFEGDICVHSDKENYPRPLVVEWIDEFACFAFVDKGDFDKKYYFAKEDMKNIEIVGIIHDNRNLLK